MQCKYPTPEAQHVPINEKLISLSKTSQKFGRFPVCLVLGTASVTAIEKKRKKLILLLTEFSTASVTAIEKKRKKMILLLNEFSTTTFACRGLKTAFHYAERLIAHVKDVIPKSRTSGGERPQCSNITSKHFVLSWLNIVLSLQTHSSRLASCINF